MKSIFIEATKNTPKIALDKANGIFEVSGNSSPENIEEFYQPILDWLKQYNEDPNPMTELVFKLDFFNSSSSKYILNILGSVEYLDNLVVHWYSKDEDMEESGEEFSEIVDIEFEFISS